MEKEKKKQKNVNDHDKKAESAKALHVSKYKHSYQNERVFMEDRFEEAHFLISYDPPEDGNCQFSVICESLRSVGIDRSDETTREEIVEYLENHPQLQNFTTVAWPTYIKTMAQDGTYGDHLTLQAAADFYNVEFIVISSLGPSATTIISPLESLPLYSFHIGHFAEAG